MPVKKNTLTKEIMGVADKLRLGNVFIVNPTGKRNSND